MRTAAADGTVPSRCPDAQAHRSAGVTNRLEEQRSADEKDPVNLGTRPKAANLSFRLKKHAPAREDSPPR